jgi:hypothetical protein
VEGPFIGSQRSWEVQLGEERVGRRGDWWHRRDLDGELVNHCSRDKKVSQESIR